MTTAVTDPAAPVVDASDGLRLIKPAVRAQPAYTLAVQPATRKLNQNEAPSDLEPELKAEILARVAAAPWHRYPEFVPRALAEALATHYGWVADGILVGNGSNELIQATLSVVLDRDDAVVAPAPTFSLYRLLTSVYGGRYHPVPFGPDFRFDVDRLIATANEVEAKAVVVNTPNNPTGSVLTAAEVLRIVEETDALVLCDEAYLEFGGETVIPHLGDHPRLVVLRTFSKAMGMAGLRFGVALAHPAIAREIAKAKLPYNVNLVTLVAAEVVMGHAETIARRSAAVVAGRERAIAALRQLPGLTVYDSAANFFVVRSHAMPARTLFARLLDEHGILVRDVSSNAGLEECLRISVGTDDDVDAVIAAFTRLYGETTR